MIRKVLIATDGSAHARKAVALGSDIAAKYGAEVMLVHVLLHGEVSEDLKRMAEVEHLAGEGGKPLAETFAAVPAGHFPAYVTFADEEPAATTGLLQAIGAQILDRAEDLAVQHGVDRISKRIEDGKPVDRILAIAKKEKADLIVVGARGLSALEAALMGSTSQKLSHLSPVTCLTVR